jgi:hypothetical protein
LLAKLRRDDNDFWFVRLVLEGVFNYRAGKTKESVDLYGEGEIY